MKPTLVINPHDGKTYDLAPLFDYINQEHTSFLEISERFQSIGDMIIQIMDPEQLAFLKDVQDNCYFLSNLRNVFKKIKTVEDVNKMQNC